MRIFILICFLACASFSYGQGYSWEIGGRVGTSNYFGDIGGTQFDGQFGPLDMMWNTTRYSVGAFTRRRFAYSGYLNGQVNYSLITAEDQFSPNTGRYSRNLNFENHLIELLVMAEIHPVIIRNISNRGGLQADFHWYLSSGLGVLYSNPIGKFGSSNVPLRPLQTEGQENPYSQVQLVLPVTTGIFFTLKGRYTTYKVHRFGFDINYRFTFTDYLDDVSTNYPDPSVFNGNQKAIQASYRGFQEDPSQPNTYPAGGRRGNPNRNDGYLTLTICYSKLIVTKHPNNRLPRSEIFYPKRKRRR